MASDENNAHIALEVTDSAKNNTFIDCEVKGGARVGGAGNQFIRTNVDSIKREHPFLYGVGVIGAVVGIPASLIAIIQFLFRN